MNAFERSIYAQSRNHTLNKHIGTATTRHFQNDDDTKLFEALCFTSSAHVFPIVHVSKL